MAIPITLGNTIGAAFLGCVAAAVLYGITNLQVFMYYLSYPKDWQFQKISVAVLWALDSLHLGLTIHAVYHYLIDSFGNLVAEEFVFWSFKLQIAVNIFIIMLVQTLYSVRVWRIARSYSKIWPSFVIVCVVAGYAVGIILAVKTYKLGTFFEISTISWAVDLSFAYATFVDIVIAVAICFYLSKSKSGFSSTDSKVHQIMKFVVGSGILTSACSMTALFLFVGMPGNLIFIGVEFLLTKLYINSFLAMLNARKSIHENETLVASQQASGSKLVTVNTFGGPSRFAMSHGHVDDKDNIDLLPLSSRSDFKGSHYSRRSQEAIGITVHRQVEHKADFLDSR